MLLSTYGSRGDVEPMVALAVQLRVLGADVRVCAPPDEDLVALLARAAVPLVPFDRPWRSWVRPSTAEERTRRVAEFIEAQFDTVATAARDCDVVVGAAMSHFVVGSVAELLGIRYVSVIFAPHLVEDPDASSWQPIFGPSIDGDRASRGLPPVGDVRTFMFTDQPWLAADPVLGPLSPSVDLDVVHTGAWLLPDVRPLPPDVTAFLEAGTPPVYVGFGSMRAISADLARIAIEAIRARGRRVLVGRGWADLALVDERDDCHAVGEVNQQALFARVAAVVHHGGAGTTTAAARAGAPQVVVPQAGGDQPYWAGRVAELGIGAALDDPTPDVGSLAEALDTALAGETRAGARAVAGWIRTDGAAAAAARLVAADPS